MHIYIYTQKILLIHTDIYKDVEMKSLPLFKQYLLIIIYIYCLYRGRDFISTSTKRCGKTSGLAPWAKNI